MTKMADMAINSKKKTLKIFSRTRRLMILKLGMKHQAMELYNVYINHDPWTSLTYFTARSTYVSYAFEWGKLLNFGCEEQNVQEMGK